MHQVISTGSGKIMHREIFCFCSRPHTCQCHNPTMVNLQTASAKASVQDNNDPNGNWGKQHAKFFTTQLMLQVISETELLNSRYTWLTHADLDGFSTHTWNGILAFYQCWTFQNVLKYLLFQSPPSVFLNKLKHYFIVVKSQSNLFSMLLLYSVAL